MRRSPGRWPGIRRRERASGFHSRPTIAWSFRSWRVPRSLRATASGVKLKSNTTRRKGKARQSRECSCPRFGILRSASPARASSSSVTAHPVGRVFHQSRLEHGRRDTQGTHGQPGTDQPLLLLLAFLFAAGLPIASHVNFFLARRHHGKDHADYNGRADPEQSLPLKRLLKFQRETELVTHPAQVAPEPVPRMSSFL